MAERAQSGSDGARRTQRGPGVAAVIRTARAEMQDLTGRSVIGVSAVEPAESGWRLELEMVELERIPASTSVLGSYDLHVDRDGHVQQYSRTHRYYRNRADETGE